MPEGDTIYRAARALRRALAGKSVTGFDTGLALLAREDDDRPLVGRVVDKVEARGKWCLIHFSGDLILVTHMLMSGSWHLYRTGERWRLGRAQMRVVVKTADWDAVAFNVPVAKFYTARQLERDSQIPKVENDLLSGEFTLAGGVERLAQYAAANPDAEIAVVLLNQRVLAGLGNVYKSEVAFAAGVNPFRAMRTIVPREMQAMVELSERYMKANVLDGSGDGIVTYAGARRTTRSGDAGARLWVYGRQGLECRRCGATVMMRKQGIQVRSTYWCPQCQPWIGPGEAPVGRDTQIRRTRVGC